MAALITKRLYVTVEKVEKPDEDIVIYRAYAGEAGQQSKDSTGDGYDVESALKSLAEDMAQEFFSGVQ